MVEEKFPEAIDIEVYQWIKKLYPHQYSDDPNLRKNDDLSYIKTFFDAITYKQYETGKLTSYPANRLPKMKKILHDELAWNIYTDQAIDGNYSFSLNFFIPIFKSKEIDATPIFNNRDEQISALRKMKKNGYCPYIWLFISRFAPFYTTVYSIADFNHKYALRNPSVALNRVNPLEVFTLDELLVFENVVYKCVDSAFSEFSLKRIPNKFLFLTPPGWENERGMDDTPIVYTILFDNLGAGLDKSPF